MPEFQDRILKCADCGAEFVFTAGEQHFFHDKNFKNEPKRCKACKGKRQGASASGSQRVETTTVCSQCGRETTVPFRPPSQRLLRRRRAGFGSTFFRRLFGACEGSTDLRMNSSKLAALRVISIWSITHCRELADLRSASQSRIKRR